MALVLHRRHLFVAPTLVLQRRLRRAHRFSILLGFRASGTQSQQRTCPRMRKCTGFARLMLSCPSWSALFPLIVRIPCPYSPSFGTVLRLPVVCFCTRALLYTLTSRISGPQITYVALRAAYTFASRSCMLAHRTQYLLNYSNTL